MPPLVPITRLGHATRIHQIRGGVLHVAIPIQALGQSGSTEHWVAAEEAAGGGVIVPRPQVLQPGRVRLLSRELVLGYLAATTGCHAAVGVVTVVAQYRAHGGVSGNGSCSVGTA